MIRHFFGWFALVSVMISGLLVSAAGPSFAWVRGGGGGGGGWHGGFHGSSVVVNNRVFVSNRMFVGHRFGHPFFFRHHFFRPCCFGSRFFFGVDVVAPLWYPYPYPVYSSPAVVESSPAYVQTGAQPQQYWYYCQDAQAYYPYVKECSGGWLQVVPQPTPSSQ